MKLFQGLMFKLYSIQSRRLRINIIKLLKRIENGEFYSLTLRKIFSFYHKVDVGLYTHGGCFVPRSFSYGTIIGRYSSIAITARGFNRDHPLNYKSTHAFFFNPDLGICEKEIIDHNNLEIGNDVWIGHNAIILTGVEKIGNGAVIGAGSVVNRNVPPYAVFIGNPGRVVRYRFSKEKIQYLLHSKWWEKPIKDYKKMIYEFQIDYEKQNS